MSESVVDRIRHLVPIVASPEASVANRDVAANLTTWMQNASDEQTSEVFEILCSIDAEQWKDSAPEVSALLVGFVRKRYEANENEDPSTGVTESASIAKKTLETLGKVYPALDSHPTLQALLLRVCVADRTEFAFRLFADWVTQTTTLDSRLQLEVFGDVLRAKKDAAVAIFPKLLDATDNLSWCALVLDYANYVYRQQFVKAHPAAERLEKLNLMLSTVSERLQQLQDTPPETNEERLLIGKQVTEGVAICIALCDALACIGDESAVASLNKALQVEHRRLRVEAAAALGKLGVEDAKKVLTAMAAEPIERLRVLAYAEELGILDEVEDEFSNIVARAEAEFVMHLAQPTQMGFAPQHIELLDQREQAWPGYEEPRNCYLFQFLYQFPSGELTNIGIAGPVVMTFESDLTVLSHDDIYAIFAGWHVEHPDIFPTEANQVAGQDSLHLQRMLRSLTESEEFEDVYPALLGNLLERRFLVASAMRQGENGWAMVSEDEVSWLGIGNPERPLGPLEAFHLFVGRSLLRSFN